MTKFHSINLSSFSIHSMVSSLFWFSCLVKTYSFLANFLLSFFLRADFCSSFSRSNSKFLLLKIRSFRPSHLKFALSFLIRYCARDLPLRSSKLINLSISWKYRKCWLNESISITWSKSRGTGRSMSNESEGSNSRTRTSLDARPSFGLASHTA